MLDSLLEIELKEREDFLKIIETLTRIGIESRDKKLVQTCHILHKRGKYYICHYRELFKLDGFERDISEEDILRRNGIALLLEQWNLCKILGNVEPNSLAKVKIIPFHEKNEWTLKANYTIGNRK
jgi:hypothetical protein